MSFRVAVPDHHREGDAGNDRDLWPPGIGRGRWLHVVNPGADHAGIPDPGGHNRSIDSEREGRGPLIRGFTTCLPMYADIL
jgi:hypothetical protein